MRMKATTLGVIMDSAHDIEGRRRRYALLLSLGILGFAIVVGGVTLGTGGHNQLITWAGIAVGGMLNVPCLLLAGMVMGEKQFVDKLLHTMDEQDPPL